MKTVQIALLVGGAFLIQNCSPAKPKTSLSDLQGLYGAQGCREFSITGSRIIAKDVRTSFVIKRIKGQDYLVLDRGVAVDESICRLVPFHVAEMIPVTKTEGRETLDILGSSRRTSVIFSKVQLST
ncbi:MAG: hypothetical protein QOD54_1814 [Sphingomonadales bacterium]|nr:hypothetical protein [Sphingomonadales bacterium]